jgi:hypothetical protein
MSLLLAGTTALGAVRLARGAKHLWDSSKHPRGPDGKFITAGKLSFRVSPRSATVMYGHTLPIVPGKANLYVGVLARVERAPGYKTGLEKSASNIGKKLTAKFPQKIQTVLHKGSIEGPGGTQITFAKPKVRQPQLRAYRKTGAKSVAGIKNSTGVRSPNRKPRTRGATLPTSVAPPPRKAINSGKGKKVKKK